MDSEFFKHTQLGPDGCLLWTGKLNRKGRPVWRKRGLFSSPIASRISYQLLHGVGSIPPTKCVLHTCHNRLCVNPHHLFIGTQSENLDQMYSIGRGAKPEARSRPGERNGSSKYSEEVILKVLKASGALRDISLQLNVGYGTVRKVKLGQSWKHLGQLS